METKDMPRMTPLPGIFSTVREGFDFVSTHAQLLILPIALDLFLLFGPRLRVYHLFERMIKLTFAQLRAGVSERMAWQVDQMGTMMLLSLKNVNLFGALQTFPVGVPTLFAGVTPTATPLGLAEETQMASYGMTLLVVALLGVIGFVLGSLYFTQVAQVCAEKPFRFTLAGFWNRTMHAMLFCLCLLVMVAILCAPASCLLSVLMTAAPGLFSIFVVIAVVLIGSTLLPLAFAVHAIYLRKQNVVQAVKISWKLGPWASVSLMVFLTVAAVLILGLDLVWSIPQSDSWLVLFSIFGHAVVNTSLLAASFLLFRKFELWYDENQAFIQWRLDTIPFGRTRVKEDRKEDQMEGQE